MFFRVCIYICMYVSMYVCMYIYIRNFYSKKFQNTYLLVKIAH